MNFEEELLNLELELELDLELDLDYVTVKQEPELLMGSEVEDSLISTQHPLLHIKQEQLEHKDKESATEQHLDHTLTVELQFDQQDKETDIKIQQDQPHKSVSVSDSNIIIKDEIEALAQRDAQRPANNLQQDIPITLHKHKCQLCTRSFKDKSHLTRHQRVHTQEKPYSCEICHNSFTDKSVLKRHYRTHTGEKPYSCELCPLSFTVKSSLTKHLRIHTGEKPYSCEFCARSFSAKSSLTKHRRMHTGEKPYSCELCPRSFTSKSNLNSHQRIHRGNKPYSCSFCWRLFSIVQSLKHHEYMVHIRERNFECDYCNEKFVGRKELINHMKKLHNLPTIIK